MVSLKLNKKGISKVHTKRKSQGLSYWELASSAYVSESTVKRFASGKSISAENFKMLCKVLGIEEWECITDTPDLDGKRVPHAIQTTPELATEEETGTVSIIGNFEKNKQRQIRVAVEMLKSLLMVGTVQANIAFDEDDL